MCGIIGYVGSKTASNVLIDGLRRLEYRGYDSSGVVVLQDGVFEMEKRPGKLSELEKVLSKRPLEGHIGIGHTRWATHGQPNQVNAHPHLSCDESLVLVHNGIIENFESLKRELMNKGHQFNSHTDTEVAAHLVEEYYDGDPLKAIQKAVKRLEGAYSLVIMFNDHPDTIFAVRLNSPLILGKGRNEGFVASDIPAILPYTRQVIALEEQEIAVVTRKSIRIVGFNGRSKTRKPKKISWDVVAAEKEGFPHFMLKEIYEQPKAVAAAIRGRIDVKQGEVKLEDLGLNRKTLKGIKRVLITACGTAWHAGIVAKYAIEELARIPAEAWFASEMRYSHPVLGPETLVLAITQSGETMDTLAATRMAQAEGSPVLAITNGIGNTMSREADGVIQMRSGIEVGVAATKTYVSQVTCGILLAIYLGRLRKTLKPAVARDLLKGIRRLPEQLKECLSCDAQMEGWAQRYKKMANYMYIGRRYNLATAFEGALKLKEISYVHAEGYGGGEMKHGPLALVDSSFPTLAVAVQGPVYDKTVSNIQEIKARKGKILAVATEGDKQILAVADDVVYVPATAEILSPILTVVPLQLHAYYTGVKRGCDVDQPRNLAKSVTVE
jgi:glucosamine--fructose-6-phosphate aminotransferase (isomerizing)